MGEPAGRASPASAGRRSRRGAILAIVGYDISDAVMGAALAGLVAGEAANRMSSNTRRGV